MRKFGPLTASHPLVEDAELCAACKAPFHAGEYVVLLALGPGADPVERHRADAGQPYTAVAIPLHLACAVGEEETSAGSRPLA